MARLPPFTTLQAFEAAVRHRSYSKAARELNLTHGAISHQLRRLETDLGAVLFQRSGNDMLPTPVAQELAGAVAKSFADLGRALDGVRRSWWMHARLHRDDVRHASVGQERTSADDKRGWLVAERSPVVDKSSI